MVHLRRARRALGQRRPARAAAAHRRGLRGGRHDPLRISAASAAARGAARTTPVARPGQPARAPVAADPALLPGVGRRAFTTEPAPPAPGRATPPPAPAPAAARGDAPPDPALLPQLLAAVLGVVAAALAFREVARHTRRRPPPGRHVRGDAPPDPGPPTAGDPDPGRTTSQRP